MCNQQRSQGTERSLPKVGTPPPHDLVTTTLTGGRKHNNMKSVNDHIASMLVTLIDTSVKTNKQDKKITELSSKISTYEDHLEKMIHKKYSYIP